MGSTLRLLGIVVFPCVYVFLLEEHGCNEPPPQHTHTHMHNYDLTCDAMSSFHLVLVSWFY